MPSQSFAEQSSITFETHRSQKHSDAECFSTNGANCNNSVLSDKSDFGQDRTDADRSITRRREEHSADGHFDSVVTPLSEFKDLVRNYSSRRALLRHLCE